MRGKWKIRRQSVTFPVGLVGLSQSSRMDSLYPQTTPFFLQQDQNTPFHMVKVRLWCCSKAVVPHSSAAEKCQKCCQSYSNTEFGRISRCLTDINWIRTLHVCELNGILPMGHWVESRGVAPNVLKLSENEKNTFVLHLKISNIGHWVHSLWLVSGCPADCPISENHSLFNYMNRVFLNYK